MDDIPLLAGRFLTRIAQRGKAPPVIAPETMTVLTRYPWPGNVRELESVLERAMLNSREEVLGLDDLPDVVQRGRALIGTDLLARPVISVGEAEREAIVRAGVACNGNLSEMAQHLGIGRTTLWRKMRQYHLVADQFKL